MEISPIELILPATRPITPEAKNKMSEWLGGSPSFLSQSDSWDAVTAGEQMDVRRRFHAAITFFDRETTVPVTLLAVNKSGSRENLFGSPDALVIDPSERQVAVFINDDYLPGIHIQDEKALEDFEKVYHGVIAYIPSNKLFDPLSTTNRR